MIGDERAVSYLGRFLANDETFRVLSAKIFWRVVRLLVRYTVDFLTLVDVAGRWAEKCFGNHRPVDFGGRALIWTAADSA